MNNFKLESIINKKLHTNFVEDLVPNGLQVEGRSNVENVITGVTACQNLIEKAISVKADAILVHHGYFWKKESPVIKGIKKKRLQKLLSNNINLYSWHYPLDVNLEFGNNVQLAKLLKIKILNQISPFLFFGKFKKPITGNELSIRIAKSLNRKPFYFNENFINYINTVAWSCGAGQNFIDNVAEYNIDAFITGEVSEQTIHSARENKIHFFAAGHHATERAGIYSLGEWLRKKYDLNVTFFEVDNPI